MGAIPCPVILSLETVTVGWIRAIAQETRVCSEPGGLDSVSAPVLVGDLMTGALALLF